MSIVFKDGVFSLRTDHTLYQFAVDRYGVLNHIWYGEDTREDMSYLYDYPDAGFSPSIEEAGSDRTYSLDTRLQEYPVWGTGDYRLTAGKVRSPKGFHSLDLRYEGYEIEKGRKPLPGMPYTRASEDCQTLVVHLYDSLLALHVDLNYVVFPEYDVIARYAVYKNDGKEELVIEQAASAVLDLGNEEMDLIHFAGRHAKERQFTRSKLDQGIVMLESRRGTSSHHQNPGIILAEKDTTETRGCCYGALLVYSGSFQAGVEKDFMGQLRLVMGIHPELFEWHLQPEESFTTPEVLLSFSGQGFGPLSHHYHDLINACIVPARFQNRPRPILINNWEATYFDFDDEKILKIADKASELGIEMLVLDDGWFGIRNNDKEGLGDWYVNEEKLNGPLSSLIARIHEKGLRFGIWIEPEMVSEDSRLFESHPDWALRIPGRGVIRGRDQLVLDLSNPDVVNYLYDSFHKLLSENDIDYVKWDMNRSISDWYSAALDAQNQKELPHRYVLGLYDLMDRLTSTHPEVMFEGCSGGGGRFDAGMLFYQPQIWASDNTDAHDRVDIQYGTSFFYPISSVGAHVSAVPNHQTGRETSLAARGAVAMAGSFGYELDLNTLSEKEQEMVKKQCEWYRKMQPLIYKGDYYRLVHDNNRSIWMFVSKDKKYAFVEGLIYETRANQLRQKIRLKGLDPNALYTCVADNFIEDVSDRTYTGQALMTGGYLLPVTWSTDAPVALVFRQV